jgi:hypothetical protein
VREPDAGSRCGATPRTSLPARCSSSRGSPRSNGRLYRAIKLYANEEVIPDVALCGHAPGNSGRAGGTTGG